MSVPKPTRVRPGGDREIDVHELPRNEATRQRPSGTAADAPGGDDTAAQDHVSSTDDIDIEATLLDRSTYPPSGQDWRQAERPFEPGLDSDRSEADADGTDRNAARRDDPDA